MTKLARTKMPEQEPQKRRHNFAEVNLGYTPEQAAAEAARCLQCASPRCVAGCPVQIDIPAFIKLIAEKKYPEAYQKIRETNALPAVCGRACPQEDQCEGVCIVGIKNEPVAIGHLERFVSDLALASNSPDQPVPKKNGQRIAIVGAGPAGLTCAGDLAKLGYEVTIFEALQEPGGVLVYGIPEFRLPKNIIKAEVEEIKKLGVKLETDFICGKIVDLNYLSKNYAAVFIGIGAGTPKFMNIPGEELIGVYSANEYLTRINLMRAYRFPEYDTPPIRSKKTIVIGGGNVAMDAARSALRTGAEVTIVYRRTEAELPARREEYKHALEEGINFKFLSAPVKVLSDGKGKVAGLECLAMTLGEPDSSGRRRPVEVPGSNFSLEADTIIVAIGTDPNPILLQNSPGLKLNPAGYIIADASGKTSLPNVYAGGDIVTGAATIIEAMGAGKTAAAAMHSQLSSTPLRDNAGRG